MVIYATQLLVQSLCADVARGAFELYSYQSPGEFYTLQSQQTHSVPLNR